MSTILLGYIFLSLLLVLLYVWYKSSLKQGTLPPGPRGIPVLGNALQISKNAPQKFSQWAKQYGKMYTIYLGRTPTLVVNDATLIRQLFGLPASTGKFPSPLIDMVFEGAYGVINTEGRFWAEQRHFFLKAFRNCGTGKSSIMEPLILEELDQFCEEIKNMMSFNGKVHLSSITKLTTGTGNIILAVITGERKETEIGHLMEKWLQWFQHSANCGLAFYSWIRYIAPKWSGYVEYAQACADIREFVTKYFEDRKRSERYEQDMISACLKQIKVTEDQESSFYGRKGFTHAVCSIVTLLIAGTESTANTMNWILFYMSVHPGVQAKVQNEIESCIGNREPRLEDRSRMPYTEAVIEESFRMSSVIAFGLIHKLMEDTSFHSYNLTKGTFLIANIYHAHHDPNVWGDPENFRPERFLEKGERPQAGEENGGKNNLRNYMIPFQPGKRVCIGESMARDVLFLFVTKLLKTFTFRTEKGRQKVEYMDGDKVGMALAPRKDVAVTANLN